jgi:hypothetical protein
MVSPFCATRKDYSKPPTLNHKKTRIPFMQRERAAIIKLRKLGYSINTLATFTGRSCSVIHRILNTYFNRTKTVMAELRKMPNALRLQTALKHRLSMDFRIEQWMPFILGEEDKPP